MERLKVDVPRAAFDQDLLYSFGAFMTVCEIRRNNAEARIRAILASEAPPVQNRDVDAADTDAEEVDVIQLAEDQISTFIQQKFKGHALTRLVAAVLVAEGYVTHVSGPGADGGVDVLAGSGPLGFSSPRICVQVKSQQTEVDVNVFRALQGSMQTFHAEQGLLVSWGGFKKAVHKESRLSFFNIRLWGAAELVRAILKNYDKLPGDLQSELPLKRIWALVLEDN